MTSEIKALTHTKGPWNIGSKGHQLTSVWAPDRSPVAVVALRKGFGNQKAKNEMLANGRLIAAAPDLLEALRACVVSLDVAAGDLENEYERGFYATAQNARAAIAKAVA